MNDIESLLRETEAPTMSVSAHNAIAGARRTRRRRRTTIASFGLAAALVVGVAAGANQLTAHQSSVVPAAQYGTSGPLGKLFKGLPIGGHDGHGTATVPYVDTKGAGATGGQTYVVSRHDGKLELRKDSAQGIPLPVIQTVASGIEVFRDGQNTVVAAALPRGTDSSNVLFTPAGTTSGENLRLSANTNVAVVSTPKPATVRAVTWSIGSNYYSSTGERGQVASFGDFNAYWYPQLNIYGIPGDYTDGSPAVGVIGNAGPVKGGWKNINVLTLPHGARNVQVQGPNGVTSTAPQIRRLGTSSYDLALVTSITAKPLDSFVQSVTWTDSAGRHTKSYS